MEYPVIGRVRPSRKRFSSGGTLSLGEKRRKLIDIRQDRLRSLRCRWQRLLSEMSALRSQRSLADQNGSLEEPCCGVLDCSFCSGTTVVTTRDAPTCLRRGSNDPNAAESCSHNVNNCSSPPADISAVSGEINSSSLGVCARRRSIRNRCKKVRHDSDNNFRRKSVSPATSLADERYDDSQPSSPPDLVNGTDSPGQHSTVNNDHEVGAAKLHVPSKCRTGEHLQSSALENDVGVFESRELSDFGISSDITSPHIAKKVGRPTSKEKMIERARHEAETMRRIKLLRKQGLWSDHPLSKANEPKRTKSHWDYLVEEFIWLSNDFVTEVKWKKAAAKKCSRMILKYHQDKASQDERASKDLERDLRRVASFVSREIRTFWTNIEKVVEFKMNAHLEEKRKRALDQHLNFIVDQTEKYSERLTEALKPELKLPSAVAVKPQNKPACEVNMSDGEFEPDSASDDDEKTIAVAENEQLAADTTAEIEALQKESALSMDDILDSLPPGYLDEIRGASKTMSSSDENEDDNKSSCSTDQENQDQSEDAYSDQHSDDVAESIHRGEEDDEDSRMTDVSSVAEDTAHKQAPATKSEADVGLKELLTEADDDDTLDGNISDVAAMAQSFQPKGYTLSSTVVKTAVPFLLKHSLREYQHVGLEWLATMYDKNLNGILADEMGLGKTIQTIALLAHLACAKANWGPHLVVVPTSVMLNWEMEFKKWCPAFKILVYYGAIKERRLKRIGWTKENAFHVCITSYKLVVQDHAAFRRKEWEYLILDEAQNIKNFKSQRWQLLLNFNSQSRLLLTGTPLQNNLMELWSLMHFLMPHVFASHREFKEWFASPLTGMVEGSSEYNDKIVRRLHKVLRPFLLRRLKSEVEKQMPKKFEHVISCRLSKRQRFLYDEFMSRSKTKETLASGNFLSVIDILMQLRKVCNHPDMFEPRPIVAPFLIPSLDYRTASLVWSVLQYDPLVNVSLDTFNLHLVDLELQLTAFAAHRIRRFQTHRRIIEEVDKMPLPPPRCPAGRIKLHVRANNAAASSPTGAAQTRPFATPSVRAAAGRPIIVPGSGRPSAPAARPTVATGTGGYTLQLLHGGVMRTVQLSALGAAAAPLALALQRAGVKPNTPATAGSGTAVRPTVAVLAGARPPTSSPPADQQKTTTKPVNIQLSANIATPTARMNSVVDSVSKASIVPPRVQLILSPQKAGQKNGNVSGALSAVTAPVTSVSSAGIRPAMSSGLMAATTAAGGVVRTPAVFRFSSSGSLKTVTASTATGTTTVNGCLSEKLLNTPTDSMSSTKSVRPEVRSSAAAVASDVTMATAPSANSVTSTQPSKNTVTMSEDEKRAAEVALISAAERAAVTRQLELPVLVEMRQRHRRCQLSLINRINRRRCEACPVYGADLIRAATVLHGAPISGYFAGCWNRIARDVSPMKNNCPSVDPLSLCVFHPSVQHMLNRLDNILARFLFYVPRAICPAAHLHVSHPAPWTLTEIRHARLQLSHHVTPLLRPLHQLVNARAALFPERRLIQYDCGKLQVLDRLLHELRSSGHRVLIFTQMTRMLDILEQFLNFHGHIYLRMDGTTRVEQRQALMERFNADRRIFCFILSTRSGGIGVNLTGADTVIFYDSDWNPTMDAQAQDRCHRIGQTRDVHIYRLISDKTIEENILKKANQKRMLGDLAIEGGNFTASFFKQRTLHTLFEHSADSLSESDNAVSDGSRVNANKQAAYERALATVEDEKDADAARDACAEVQAELSEFDDNSEAANRPSRAQQEVGRLLEQLSAVERWAVDFIERTDDVLRREGARATAQLAAQEREWEASQKLVLQQHEERKSTQSATTTQSSSTSLPSQRCHVTLERLDIGRAGSHII